MTINLFDKGGCPLERQRGRLRPAVLQEAA